MQHVGLRRIWEGGGGGGGGGASTMQSKYSKFLHTNEPGQVSPILDSRATSTPYRLVLPCLGRTPVSQNN